MEVPIDTSKMSDQELQFHYFKMHDADNNNKLDGSELIKSLIHWHGKRSVHQYAVSIFFIQTNLNDELFLLPYFSLFIEILLIFPSSKYQIRRINNNILNWKNRCIYTAVCHSVDHLKPRFNLRYDCGNCANFYSQKNMAIEFEILNTFNMVFMVSK